MNEFHPGRSGLAAAISALGAVGGTPVLELFHAIAERYRGIVFEIDNEGRVMRSVGAQRRAMDPERGRGDGRLVSEIYADTPELLAAIRRALGGECVEIDIEIDGREYAVEYAPLLGGDGTVTRVVGFAALRDAPSSDAAPDGRGAA